MSASSARRIKERGGGDAGGKVAGAPTGKISPLVGRSISTGKENPRPTSRVRAATQKPTIRPMARIDKSAVAAPAAEEPRSRRSTSSVPRGRSSSPSEFTRVLSDMRKNSSRVSLESSRRRENSVTLKGLNEKSGEKSDLEKRVSKDLVKNEESVSKFQGGFQENKKVKIRVENSGNSNAKEEALCSDSLGADLEKRGLKDFEKKRYSLENPEGDNQENRKINFKVLNGNSEEREPNLSSTTVKRSYLDDFSQDSSIDSDLKSSKISKEAKLKSCTVGVASGLMTSGESKVAVKKGNCSVTIRENVANKYPSKLHEKLAFLEGKVNRIASDIKKTKEILDMNNPDASKLILSDIQEKVSGIEKAMGYVAGTDGGSKVGSVRSEGGPDEKEEKGIANAISLGKGLNAEELEARLFPHHKLIRDRTFSKTTSRGSETHVLVGESTSIDEEKSTTFDDNAITTEFLTSLNKEESHDDPVASKLQEMDEYMTSIGESSSLHALNGKGDISALLMADEKLDEFDEAEKVSAMILEEEVQEELSFKLNDIGHKTSTGGWFVSEGESVLLAHDDGSCSFYDISNSEEKAEYSPPAGILPSTWQDCWIIRAPCADGCYGRYVVAASAGNSVQSGFCSWDFYTKQIRAFKLEDETPRVRTALAPISNNTMYERNTLSSVMATENRQWWYKPCGPLIVSTASSQRMVQIYDIRDGEQVMKWELRRPVVAMDYASPLQWRNRGKVAVAQSDAISLWDVSSLSSRESQSVYASGRKITAFHVNNTDAELGGGVRQRVSSSEVECNDGVFCTSDSINVLDFRQPSGIALKMPKVGVDVQSAFSRGDSVYIGCSSLRSAGKQQYTSQIQQFSLRKQQLFSTYTLPESNAHSHYTALTQVWGNSSLVMGVCGLGLFVFDSLKDDGLPSFTMDYNSSTQNVKEIIGPDDMYYPTFDYLASRVLLISKDRPARWRYLF